MSNSVSFDIYDRLKSRQACVAVVGTGYVGGPVLAEFSKYFDVKGYDTDPAVITRMKGIFGENVEFSASENILDKASFYIVTVPTPIDGCKQPDLTQLIQASEMIARHLKRGDYVVFESTVYPECTEGVCVPVLEKISRLKAGDDFKVGYSPERINPGDELHTFANTAKVVAANDKAALDEIARIYSTVIDAPVHKASGIKVAEASKIVENIQRSVNIALMNELYRLFHHMGVDFSEINEMASTKWNFMPCHPGLVGGHCIPVDPYYLLSEAVKSGIDLPVTRSACMVNDSMAAYIADSLSLLFQNNGSYAPRVLIMGITYKENTDDLRNSQSAVLAKLLIDKSYHVDVTDPWADDRKVYSMCGVHLSEPAPPYDIIITAVSHDQYAALDDRYFQSISRCGDTLLVDIGGRYKDKIISVRYWNI